MNNFFLKWRIRACFFEALPSMSRLTFLFLFASCSFYPKYQRPEVEMPEHWRLASDESQACNLRWWQQFQDPILDALIQEALASNNDLKVASARITQYQAQAQIVSSQLYPQLYGQANASRTRNSQTLSTDPTSSSSSYGGVAAIPGLSSLFPVISNNYQTVFTAAYEVDLWGKIRSASDAAYSDLLEQVYAQRSVILTLVSSVAASYTLLRQFDWQLRISKETVRSRKESYELAKIRFEEGLTSELEVAQSLAELDQAALQVIEYETLIAQQENLLSVLIGHAPQTILRGLSIENWTLSPVVPTGLPSDLLQQRPDILQAEEAILAANFRIGEARALYFPDITLTGFFGAESAQLHRLFTDPSQTWQWMANLLQPIFTGWRITSAVDLAKAVKEESIYQYIQTVLNALKEVDDALIKHQNAKKALEVQKAVVKDLELYLYLATLQYQNGLVDYLNVLDAERRLFEAELDLARGEANVFLSLIDIYKALGGGWVIDAEKMMQQEQDSPLVEKCEGG